MVLVLFRIIFYASNLNCSQFLTAPKDVNLLESVPDLQKSMYKVVDGFPCVRLLKLSGEIGCSSRYPSSSPRHTIKYSLCWTTKYFRMLYSYPLLPVFIVSLDPGREKIVAPIIRYQNADKLAQLSAIVVPLQEFDSFFQRYVYFFCYF